MEGYVQQFVPQLSAISQYTVDLYRDGDQLETAASTAQMKIYRRNGNTPWVYAAVRLVRTFILTRLPFEMKIR